LAKCPSKLTPRAKERGQASPIRDAFGKDWFKIRRGEASVFKPDGSGAYRLIVRAQADEQAKFAQSVDDHAVAAALAPPLPIISSSSPP
jgi:hypothetical protein